MPKYSQRSLGQLWKADIRLQLIFNKLIVYFDVTILESHRNATDQEEMFNSGKSKLLFPKSKHNHFPSKAVDVAPYPIDWKNKERFYFMAGIVKAIAEGMGIKIRWGGDWDRDNHFDDQTFNDIGHFEVVD